MATSRGSAPTRITFAELDRLGTEAACFSCRYTLDYHSDAMTCPECGVLNARQSRFFPMKGHVGRYLIPFCLALTIYAIPTILQRLPEIHFIDVMLAIYGIVPLAEYSWRYLTGDSIRMRRPGLRLTPEEVFMISFKNDVQNAEWSTVRRIGYEGSGGILIELEKDQEPETLSIPSSVVPRGIRPCRFAAYIELYRRQVAGRV